MEGGERRHGESTIVGGECHHAGWWRVGERLFFEKKLIKKKKFKKNWDPEIMN